MSLETPEVRVALIGYGLAGAAFHAPIIASVPGMRLAAIVTADRGRSRVASERFPETTILPKTELLWERALDVDFVVVATPNQTHVPLARNALEAGLSVVVDKPLSPTAIEAIRLIDLAKHKRLLLTVFQNRRWDGDFLTLQQLLREDGLGTVYRFESRFERWRPIPKPGWRQHPAPEAAGGLLYDLGSHLIDQALVLFGAVTEVYAELDRRSAGGEVDDDAFVALTHKSGVRSHLWMSTVAAQSGPRFRVLGSRVAFTKYGFDVQEKALRSGALPSQPGWGEDSTEAWAQMGAGDIVTAVPTKPGAYPQFYHGVLRALRDGAAPPVDPADAVAGLRIIEAARRSAAEGRVVALVPTHE
jgi:scyllo-inositol 2-dehydrogenase (NADP+)